MAIHLLLQFQLPYSMQWNPGDRVMLVGFGAGLTCAANIIRWDESFIK